MNKITAVLVATAALFIGTGMSKHHSNCRTNNNTDVASGCDECTKKEGGISKIPIDLPEAPRHRHHHHGACFFISFRNQDGQWVNLEDHKFCIYKKNITDRIIDGKRAITLVSCCDKNSDLDWFKSNNVNVVKTYSKLSHRHASENKMKNFYVFYRQDVKINFLNQANKK
jgi:hypothetical protein